MKLNYIDTDKGQVPYKYDLNVLAQIQNEYGSFDAWANAFMPQNEDPSIKILIKTFALMINEGIDIQSYEHNTPYTPLTTKQVGRIIEEVGVGEVTKIMLAEIKGKSKSENDPNQTTTMNQ